MTHMHKQHFLICLSSILLQCNSIVFMDETRMPPSGVNVSSIVIIRFILVWTIQHVWSHERITFHVLSKICAATDSSHALLGYCIYCVDPVPVTVRFLLTVSASC